MEAGIGPDHRVTFSELVTFGFPASLGRIVEVIERIPPVAVPLLWIFPSHLAMARAATHPPVQGAV